MTVFVDTSALFALLDEDQNQHSQAVGTWHRLLERERLFTSNYVVLEASALVQRRLGMQAVDQLHDALLLPIEMFRITDDEHAQAVARWRTAGRRRLSLVDVSSFVVMDKRAVDRAFAFDDDFAAAGFELVGG